MAFNALVAGVGGMPLGTNPSLVLNFQGRNQDELWPLIREKNQKELFQEQKTHRKSWGILRLREGKTK